jgi:hypothetical protein
MDVGPHQWEQFVVRTRERGLIVAHTEMIVVNIIVLAPLGKAQVSCLMDFYNVHFILYYVAKVCKKRKRLYMWKENG